MHDRIPYLLETIMISISFLCVCVQIETVITPWYLYRMVTHRPLRISELKHLFENKFHILGCFCSKQMLWKDQIYYQFHSSCAQHCLSYHLCAATMIKLCLIMFVPSIGKKAREKQCTENPQMERDNAMFRYIVPRYSLYIEHFIYKCYYWSKYLLH